MNLEKDRSTPTSITEIMKTAYIDYSMSVIIARALPDARDGLKPVQRRILYAMLREGLLHNRPFDKCAGVVGEVLKNYHPHGDISVYDTLVRMAQHWSLRYPLVDGQGNFGSVDGDSPAAMRYTEARLRKIAEEMLADLDKETVDFAPNFDDSLKEPTVLPTKVPNLLINGASGIAVGMATNMPPHNITEVINGTIAYINNKDRLIKFFSDKGFDKSESVNLTNAMKNAVYFLETHEHDRHEIEISLRNEIREQLASRKKGIASLMDGAQILKDIVPVMDWDAILKFEIKLIDNHEFNKSRAGKNKSLQMAMEPLFWRLARLQIGQSRQVNIVFDLFVKFDFDDYARDDYHTADQLLGKKEKKERIRKQFQQPAMKSRQKYATLFGWSD